MRSTRRPRDNSWEPPEDWAVFPDGLRPAVRNRWERDAASPSPRLDHVRGDDEGVIGGSRVRPITAADRRYVMIVVGALLVIATYGQRFVLPLGENPLGFAFPASFVAVVLLRLRGGIRYNRVRTELYVLAAVGTVIAAWFTSLFTTGSSLNSLLLLLLLYLPWVFCMSTAFSDLWGSIARLFVRLMVAAGAVGVLQMALQFTGLWQYEDYLGSWVPGNLIAQNYNTNFPMEYASPIFKANAFVFLEPSFLCQYLGLALIVGVIIRAKAWQLLVLALGMASTLSGTGILLLVVGIVLIVLRMPRAIRPAYVVAGALGLVVIFLTPAASFLLDRSDEASQQGSSGSLRFVQPYTGAFDGLQEEPRRYLIGAGPGTADRLLESDRNAEGGQAVVYTIVPKLVFEYGLVAGALFVAFMLVSILRGPPVPALPGAVVFMLFFLSGALLQPHTVALAWLLTSLWGNPVTLGVSDALAARRRQTANTLAQGQAVAGTY